MDKGRSGADGSRLRAEYLAEEHLSDEDVEIERANRREDLAGKKQNRSQRKLFGFALFAFMCLYMGAALLFVYLSGKQELVLSDAVLVTLLTTTLADVIGVFSFVAKYLFHTS